MQCSVVVSAHSCSMLRLGRTSRAYQLCRICNRELDEFVFARYFSDYSREWLQILSTNNPPLLLDCSVADRQPQYADRSWISKSNAHPLGARDRRERCYAPCVSAPPSSQDSAPGLRTPIGLVTIDWKIAGRSPPRPRASGSRSY